VTVLRRLLAFLRPTAGWVALSVLLGAATVGSGIGLLATSAYLIAAAATRPSIAALQVPIVAVRFFGLSRGVFRYLERYVSHTVTFRLLARLRVWFFRALEPLVPAGLLHIPSGDLLSRLGADVESLEPFYVRAVAPPLVALVVAAGMAAFLAGFAAELALALLAGLALAGVGVPWIIRRVSREAGAAAVRDRAALHMALVDGIQGLADLLVFAGPGGNRRSVQEAGAAYHGAQEKLARAAALGEGLHDLALNLAAWAVLVLAVRLGDAGQLPEIYVPVLVLAAMASFEAVQALPDAARELEGSLAAGERLFNVARAEGDFRPVDGLRALPKRFGLAAEDLSFRYDQGGPPALAGISFELPPGGRLAVVGPSGAGKTTLVNLLLRFWAPTSGRIRLGDWDLADYPVESLRRSFGVVSQDTYLFNATLRENLLLANPQAGPAEVAEALRAAQLEAFVRQLPEREETWVGEHGLQLSGGERRRLAVARALINDPALLILDEPTAHLDALTERALLDTLRPVMAGRTTLLITHRLVGLETMDEIVVLRAGRVIERGRHADLLALRGLYRQMWDLQSQQLPD
jgi:ATP-binding cassette subfamily C protein CydC